MGSSSIISATGLLEYGDHSSRIDPGSVRKEEPQPAHSDANIYGFGGDTDPLVNCPQICLLNESRRNYSIIRIRNRSGLRTREHLSLRSGLSCS